MRVAIFGSSGFIGTNLAQYLIMEGSHEVFGFDNLSNACRQPTEVSSQINFFYGDMTNSSDVVDFLKRSKPELIYHLVANSDIVQGVADSRVDLEKTLASTYVLLESLSQTRPAGVVFASSSAVYGDHGLSRITEESKKLPISPYGWMKLASEEILTKAAASGLVSNLLLARFPNVTGNFQTHGVIFDLMQKLWSGQNPLRVLGNGEQRKPYIDAYELSKVLQGLATCSREKVLAVNIAPYDQLTVREIVDMILSKMQADIPVSFGENSFGWKGDIPNYYLDTSRLTNLMPTWRQPSSWDAVRKGIDYMHGFCHGRL